MKRIILTIAVTLATGTNATAQAPWCRELMNNHTLLMKIEYHASSWDIRNLGKCLRNIGGHGTNEVFQMMICAKKILEIYSPDMFRKASRIRVADAICWAKH